MESDPVEEFINSLIIVDDLGPSNPHAFLYWMEEQIGDPESIANRGVTLEFNLLDGELISYLYAVEDTEQFKKSKPKGWFIGDSTYPDVSSLDDFVRDYSGQLEFSGIFFDEKVVELGGQRHYYQHTIHDDPRRMQDIINRVRGFLSHRYEEKEST